MTRSGNGSQHHGVKKSFRVLPAWSKELLSVLIVLLAWAAAVHLRPRLMGLECLSSPTACTKSSILAIDRFVMDQHSARADQLSEIGEIISALFAALVLFGLGVSSIWNKSRSWRETVTHQLSGLLFIFEVVALNGFFTEIARLLIQRPRPFVFTNPGVLGANPSHYVSFYSGHTSFVAAIGMATVLLATHDGVSRRGRDLISIIFGAIIIMTAICRVIAGVHFVTDVVAAIVAGACVPYVVTFIRKAFLRSQIQPLVLVAR